MKLQEIPKRNKRDYRAKRLGRGIGSGKGGHTVGRGQKGQSSRTGGSKGKGFEGGNRPLYSRLPKFRGFKNPNRVVYQPVNLIDIEKNYKDGEVISLASLKEKGMVRKGITRVKILAKGKLTKKIIVDSGFKMSAMARQMIEKVKGTVKAR